MSKEKIRVVRVPPNSQPMLDEIIVTPNHSYSNIKPYGLINGREFDGIWLNDEIYCSFIDTNLAMSITEKEMLFEYNGIIAGLARNRDMAGHKTYGDLIIEAEGRSLTTEEIDQYIEMFKEDKTLKGAKYYES